MPSPADGGHRSSVDSRGWSQAHESRPRLCEDCQSRTVAAERQAEADERERQEQEHHLQEQEAEQPAQKAGRWLSRLRT